MSEYETKKIGVINIKDLDGVRNAINVITHDGSRIFQCINSAAKVSPIELPGTLELTPLNSRPNGLKNSKFQ
jgi:hypothetical protein